MTNFIYSTVFTSQTIQYTATYTVMLYLSPCHLDGGWTDDEEWPVATVVAHYCQSLQGLPQTHVVSKQGSASTTNTVTAKESLKEHKFH